MDKKRKRILSLLTVKVLVVYAGMVSASHAQTTDANNDIEVQRGLDYFSLSPDALLNAEIISASRRVEKISYTPAAVYLITQEDIQRSGVTTIAEALRMAPGVQVARADSNSWAISIRGFNGVLANKLLVMIDGRSIYNPLFAGTYWDLPDYILEDIDRIEIVRGPGGALWGANAVNGVINIITKQARDTQGTLASALYGTQEKGTVSLRYGDRFVQDGHFRVYSKYFNRDSTPMPTGGENNDEWKGGRTGFRADWSDRLTLQGDVYRVLSSQKNSTPISTAPYSLIEDETMQSQGASALVKFKGQRARDSEWYIQSYLSYDSREQILLTDQRLQFDMEAQYNFAPSAFHELTAGVGYHYFHDNLSDSVGLVFNPDSRNANIFSTFVQDKMTLLPEYVFLTLGTKLEYNDFSGAEYQPNIRLQFHPDHTQMIWLAASRAVRTPSRLEHDLDLTATSPTLGAQVVLRGNKDFDSETLTAYEAGYRKQFNDSLSLDIAGFYNVYNDLSSIGILSASGGVINIEAVNGSRAETYGGEIASTWLLSDRFRLMGSYSLIDIFIHSYDETPFATEAAEGQTPHHQAGLRAYWDVNDELSLDTSLYYIDRLSQQNVDAYLKMDLNLGWHIERGIRLNVIGQNLLNDSQREFLAPTALNAAENERSIFGKITWEF